MVLAGRLSPRNPEWLALSVATGFAAASIAAYAAVLLRAMWIAPFLIGLILALGVRRTRPGLREMATAPPLGDWVGLLLIAAALAWFAGPVLARPMPQGWDPAFHTSIIEMIRRVGGLPPTWAPYEPNSKFDYPAGFHSLLAAVGSFLPVPSEVLFAGAFVAVGAAMLLMVYALGRRFGGSPAVGGAAVALYGFTDGWGTLTSHASWGGLPNLAGLVAMSGFVLAVCTPGRGALVLAAIFAASAAFVHHLSFVLLGGTVTFVVVLELVVERRLSPPVRTALGAMFAAGLTAGLVVLLNPVGRHDVAQSLRFDREGLITLGRAWEVMGAPISVLGLAGLVGALWTHRREDERLLPAWAVALLAFWVGFDIVYRGAVFFLTRQNYTAFTPSRGLTDAAVPLAVCGAILVVRLFARVPRVAPVALAAVLVALGWRGEVERWRAAPAHAEEFRGARALCDEVKRKTEPGAVIFAPNAGEVGIWLPYLCAREFNYFPEPSYATSEYRQRKGSIQSPLEFARFIGERPTYFATRGAWHGREVAAAGGWRLYEVKP